MRFDNLENSLNEMAHFKKVFKGIFCSSVDLGASDIHIEQKKNTTLVRLNINKDKKDFFSFYGRYSDEVIKYFIKVLNLKISKMKSPQTSRIDFLQKKVVFRCSMRATVDGIKLVIRILRQNIDFKSIYEKFPEDIKEALDKVIYKKSGLIVLSGATNSGKTTTLYTIIDKLNKRNVSIETIEDPIEYYFEGINQSEVSSKYSYEDFLKILLRQDPNIILIGEIRSKQELTATIQAANTGHLVLTTIHAKSAKSTIDRMIDLGASRSILDETLLLVLNQSMHICDRSKNLVQDFDYIEHGQLERGYA